MSELVFDAWLLIFSYVPIDQCPTCRLVCKFMNEVFRDFCLPHNVDFSQLVEDQRTCRTPIMDIDLYANTTESFREIVRVDALMEHLVCVSKQQLPCLYSLKHLVIHISRDGRSLASLLLLCRHSQTIESIEIRASDDIYKQRVHYDAYQRVINLLCMCSKLKFICTPFSYIELHDNIMSWFEKHHSFG